jgi:putative membrane protein
MKIKTMKTVAAIAAAHVAALAVFAEDTGPRQQRQQEQQQREEARQQQQQEIQPGQRIDEPAGAQREAPEAKQFIKQAAAGNKLEMVLGQLAQEKAQNPQVRQFGQTLLQSHQKANQELQQVAQQKGVSLDTMKFQQLIQAQGRQFDHAYLSYITEQGQKNSQHLEQIASGHQDQQVQQFARQQLNEMREHLQQVQRLQTQTQAEGQIQEPAGARPGEQQPQQRPPQQQLQGEQRLEQAAGPQSGREGMPEAGEFVKQAAVYGHLGLALSELAVQKSQNSEIQQFAKQKQQSVLQAGQQLKQLGQQHGVEVDMQKIQQLVQATGTQFDQAFVRFITEEHRKDVQKYEAVASQHSDQQIQEFARKVLPELREHLQHAQQLQTQIQAGGAIQDPAGAQPEREPQQRD